MENGVFTVVNDENYKKLFKEIPNILKFAEDFTFLLNCCTSKSNNTHGI